MHAAGAVEDPHHDLLAVHGRQRRHPQVDGLALDAEADAAVLGDAALGDVDVGHDLEPGDDAGDDRAGLAHALVEHAVDAEPDAQVELGRLDVDVRGPLLHRLEDHEVHELDDRRVLDDRRGGWRGPADRSMSPRPRSGRRSRTSSSSLLTLVEQLERAARASTSTRVNGSPSTARRSSTAGRSLGLAMATTRRVPSSAQGQGPVAAGDGGGDQHGHRGVDRLGAEVDHEALRRGVDGRRPAGGGGEPAAGRLRAPCRGCPRRCSTGGTSRIETLRTLEDAGGMTRRPREADGAHRHERMVSLEWLVSESP